MRKTFDVAPNEDVAQTQQRLKDVLDELGTAAFGKLLESQAVATTSTSIPHGLGYTPEGWTWSRPRNAAIVYEAAAPDDKFLYLISSSGTATVDIWVW